MSEITCSYGCWMKLDLLNAEDKLMLLKDNWPSFFDVESIVALSKDELKCSMCLLDVVLSAMTKKRFFYSKRKVRDLTKFRSFMSTIAQLSDVVDEDADASRQGTYHNSVDNKI